MRQAKLKVRGTTVAGLALLILRAAVVRLADKAWCRLVQEPSDWVNVLGVLKGHKLLNNL